MALKIADRVRETSITGGTGPLTLGGAVQGFRSFGSVLSIGDTCFYSAASGGEFEVGLGTYSAANTLSRTKIIASSNNNALVNFSGNTKDVFIDQPSAAFSVPQARRAVTIASPIANADKGNLVEFTSGTFTASFTSVTSLDDGWSVVLRNSGTGDITLAPASGETIDGLSSFIMYPGEVRWVGRIAGGFASYVMHPFSKIFTASGSIIWPPGYAFYEGQNWGGGGGGAVGDGTRGGAGAGGGACVPFSIPASSVTVGGSTPVNIGAGGTPGSSGGTTSIGSLAFGYGGGAATGTVACGGGGGALGPGSSNLAGQPDPSSLNAFVSNSGFGGARAPSAAGNGQAGASAAYGGATGGSGSTAQGGAGGTSLYGGAGGGGGGVSSGNGGVSTFGGNGGTGGVGSGPGSDGFAPGGGGGGGGINTGAAGNGGRGESRIRGVV